MTQDPFVFARAEHAHPSRNWHGLCLEFVHDAFGVGAREPSAAAAWATARHRHPTTDPASIPRGVPVFYLGGSEGFGHVDLSRGGGSCWTTDLIRDGQVDVAPIELVCTKWGLQLVGWTEDINGVRVWTPPATHTPRVTSRGPNVDAAIAAASKAQAYAAAHHKPGRARKLHRALAWLRSIARH